MVNPNSPDETIGNQGAVWTTQIDVPALQPQRVLLRSNRFLIGAKESCNIAISARVFADSLAQPLIRELRVRLEVTPLEVSADQVLKSVGDVIAEDLA